MNVRELMHPATESVEQATSVVDAARMMRDTGVSRLVVTAADAVEGIISESDIVLGCMADGHIPLAVQRGATHVGTAADHRAGHAHRRCLDNDH